ncbi:unnamed protein product [Paramecium octaurelia]|uniref:Uncharacterized protein n=1 Tax=Paramecium octaurelia TaxID=43137 RepID=A0A8S1U3G2_PAROT|nr:unnamed protein product [Paramecium octaurelia]
MKLQELGRLKSINTQIDQIQFPQLKCNCESSLMIKSDYQFSLFFLKDCNFQIVNESDALKIININQKKIIVYRKDVWMSIKFKLIVQIQKSIVMSI